MLVLSRRQVQAAVTMSEAIDVCEKTLIEIASGQARVPVRTQIPVKEQSVSLFMPGYLPGIRGLGIKVVSVFPENPARGRATIHAVVIMLDAETGVPEAAMEGGYLTALRTGAASGVATRHLARPDASVAAVFGAGVQGRTQLEAVSAVRPIGEARVFDVRPDVRDAYIKEMSQQLPGVRLVPAATPEAAVRGADVIITATTSTRPVFDGNGLAPGTHVNAIGAFTPTMREIDATTVTRARDTGVVAVDTLAGVLEEAGDILAPLEAGLIRREDLVEVGAIAAGRAPGRRSDGAITVYKGVGTAALDVAVGQLIVARAREKGLGSRLELLD